MRTLLAVILYVGRLHRLHDGKKVVRVYNYVDAQVSMLARMFESELESKSAGVYAGLSST